MIILRPDYNSVDIWQCEQAKPLRVAPDECVSILHQATDADLIVLIHPAGGPFTNHIFVPLQSFSMQRLWQTVPLLPEWNEISSRLAEDVVSSFPALRIMIAFDDYLFQELPESAKKYALPAQFLNEKYMKHGCDGLAHTWAAMQNPEQGPLITIHLAERTTLCGFVDGKITATSTGYSPVDGMPGEKTCGRIDPSLAIMLANKIGVSATRDLLMNECGWKALSPSMDILDNALTREMWTNELLKSIGAIAAHCGGLDRIYMFGENESFIVQTAELLRIRLAGGSLPSDHIRFLTHSLPAGKMYVDLFENHLNNV